MNNYIQTHWVTEEWISSQKHNLPKDNYEVIENLNRPTMSKGIQSAIKNLLTNKSPEPDGFTGKF